MTTIIHRAGFTPLVHPESAALEFEPAVIGQPHQVAHDIGIDILAIRRQSHHLVFLAKRIKADELTQRGVEEAQTVGQGDAIQSLYFRPFATHGHRRGKITRGIIGETSGNTVER